MLHDHKLVYMTTNYSLGWHQIMKIKLEQTVIYLGCYLAVFAIH